MLRIIAGKYRSRKIEQPSKTTTRPTVDRAREAIFSSIHFQIKDTEVLDLFSGSGAFCLEALSRGAKHATCIEKDSKAYKIIQLNKASLGEKNLDIYNTDALSFLNEITNQKYDFIYLDPPFKDKELLVNCIDLIVDKNILNLNGKIIIETDWADFKYERNNYVITKNKKYGKIYFYYIELQ
ncbi:16S rRNA (guanine(966)-N(2))-methyltransferase RsmD [[Mycoplasma] falconis]|uniref:16S rRNA (Guanine(966)-N(2))-methyltransferase RsmD n=1 Tax=[Mycoplasma] falconis TaxID=92403 RepID=A0A501X9D5_9BACT|nr:16S rRNA (guanine(966)-N(2))-methyltransferase RsmD [[Mycoplasma] falconis]TPE57086.1 16S rRNA (guanine(966)-N(2))-methyltransferase RsmD [[Mycoplasma] falconis]